jgi:xanthine dehydrogenase accessory factor
MGAIDPKCRSVEVFLGLPAGKAGGYCRQKFVLAHFYGFFGMHATPYTALEQFLFHLEQQSAVLVTVLTTQGSVPRKAGTWMAVWRDGLAGTIGGGHLEWTAVRQAQSALAQGAKTSWTHRVALGPSLGQCCGGVVELGFEPVDAAQSEALRERLQPSLTPVALFGGGHVGQAIVQALSPLPFAVHWIDSRDGVFPPDIPPQVRTEHSEPVHGAVRALPAGTLVLIMSFSHAEDLDIVAACLARQRTDADLPFVGLIGSQTKWATFRRRLSERGVSTLSLDHVTCPIGLNGITDKAPAVIAASVVAQLLLVRDAVLG